MTNETLSHRIVDYIASLHPIYNRETIGNQLAARSIANGHLILPFVDSELGPANNQFKVEVRWNGNNNNKGVIDGDYLATLALVEYAKFQVDSGMGKNASEIILDLAKHYEFKTGSSMLFSPHFYEEETITLMLLWKSRFTKFAANVFASYVAGKL